jgi:hypothetical protein
MTMPQSESAITEAQVSAFGHKLAAWADQLSEPERDILLAALGQAAAFASGDNVQGYYDPGNLRDFGSFSQTLFSIVNPGGGRSSSDGSGRPPQ